MGLMLSHITPSNIGFESFVVAATPLPIKSAAAGPPMRLQRTMLKTFMKGKVRELADTTKISTERTRHILGNILHMKKLSCRWVPRMLTPEQKHKRESTSKDLLLRNRADFWRRLVTVDETWIHYYTPGNRMIATQWTEAGTSAPTQTREAQWVGKVMVSSFWDSIPRKRKNDQQRVIRSIGGIEGRNRLLPSVDYLKCRVCFNVEELMVNIYEEVEDLNSDLSTLLEQCGDLKVDRADAFPKYLCKECTSELLIAAKFREKCCRTKEILQQYEAQYLCTASDTFPILTEPNDRQHSTCDREEKESDQYVLIETELSEIDNNAWKHDINDFILAESRYEEKEVESQLYYNELSVDNDGKIFGAEEQQPSNSKLLLTNTTSTIDDELNSEKHKEDEQNLGETGEDIIVFDPDNDIIDIFKMESSCDNNDIVVNDETKLLYSNLRFSCDICGAAFACAQNLRRHINSSHEPFQIYKCEQCSHCFAIEYNYNKHLATCSNTRSKSVPTNATEVYVSKNKNMNTIPQPSKICMYCDMECKTSFSLNIHLRTHTGERPFDCGICSKSFKTRTTLAGHMKRHVGIPDLICPYCSKTFYENSNLQAHVRTHTGEKPHVCTVCNKRFTRVFVLQLHMRTHTGEKPYTCKDCGRSFAQSCDMKNHMRTHTGDRQYRCPVCPKNFIKRRQLQIHMQRHTGLDVASNLNPKENENRT